MGCACRQALAVRMLGVQAAMHYSAAQQSACVVLAMPCRCNVGSPASAVSSLSPTTKVTNLSHSTHSSLLSLAPGVNAWGWCLAPGLGVWAYLGKLTATSPCHEFLRIMLVYPYYTISKCALSFKLLVDCGAPFEPLRGFSCSRQLGGR